MSQKLQFIEKASAPGANVPVLCLEHGISPQTSHEWSRRYREAGYTGLSEQSRQPPSSLPTTGEEVVVRIPEWRERRSTWGGDKISKALRRELGSEAPSEKQ
jgi:transposase-like protein